ASSTPSTLATISTWEPTIWWPCPSTSSITIVHATSSRPGGVPAAVSSPATDIVRQPPWAAASSSSGLVLPPGSPMRDGREKGSREELLADRKSTRLNSSHQIISYAVFCLKKKNIDRA